MKADIRIAGVVVLYRPTEAVVGNVVSYLEQIDLLFAVDNSDDASCAAFPMLAGPKVVYLPNHANLGIAAALNIGARRALAEGFDLLLTMDQDSHAAPDMVARMLMCLEEWGTTAQVGMISPFHVTKSGHKSGGGTCEDVMTPMTSGCLLNLQAYSEVGPFCDELFIDFVDNEYCLRLRKHGFAVLRANLAHLEHSVGDIKKYGPFIATNHSPLRRYYKTRNRFIVFTRYFRDFPGHCLFDLVRLIKEIGSIILFEPEKFAKLRLMWRGWCDFLRGRYGKYDG